MNVIKPIKRKNNTKLSSSINSLQRKTFDFDQIEEKKDFQINTKMQRVCYVTNWSRYRKGEAKFEIEYIDPFMCSHVIYAYATVDGHRPEIIPIQKEDIGK